MLTTPPFGHGIIVMRTNTMGKGFFLFGGLISLKGTSQHIPSQVYSGHLKKKKDTSFMFVRANESRITSGHIAVELSW